MLCTLANQEQSQILSVLARKEGNQATLRFPGDVSVKTFAGTFAVGAKEVDFQASRCFNVKTSLFGLTSLFGEMSFNRLLASIEQIDAGVGKMRFIAKKFTSTIGKLIQNVQDSFRRIENLDDTRSGRLHWRVTGQAHLHAENTTLLADRRVKIDGESIHLG